MSIGSVCWFRATLHCVHISVLDQEYQYSPYIMDLHLSSLHQCPFLCIAPSVSRTASRNRHHNYSRPFTSALLLFTCFSSGLYLCTSIVCSLTCVPSFLH